MIGRRIFVFRCIVLVLFGFLLLVLFKVQIIQGRHFRFLSEKNRIRLIPIDPVRGRIFDRNERLLAGNRPAFDLAVIPEDFDKKDVTFLAQTAGIQPEFVLAKLESGKTAPFRPVVIQRDVSREVLFQIEERKPALRGVVLQSSGLRYYPGGISAAHVLGYIGKISKEEYESQSEPIYDPDDLTGKKGIEKSFDPWLRGEKGGRQIEVNAMGREIQVLSRRSPEAGKDLTLSIDSKLQAKIWDLVGEKRASVCLLDLEDDEILALVTKPGFDPNVFVTPSLTRERMETIQDEKNRPLIDRSVSVGFPPGSVFKLVTALAGLESGKITPQTTFVCKGSFRLGPKSRTFRCWRKEGHGAVNLAEAIERSCNVYFYQAGLRIGPSLIAHTARELGLGRRVHVEISPVAEGTIPDELWKWQRLGEKWYPGETLSFAIGQGYVLTSPLQLLRSVAVIAKGGAISEPSILKKNQKRRVSRRAAVQSENLQIIRRAMLRVVESDFGTGQLARVSFTRVAGKTGTAQAPTGEPHAWFVGFFPYENPRFAIVVFIEHGGSGGYYAASMARQVIECLKEHPSFGKQNYVGSGLSKG